MDNETLLQGLLKKTVSVIQASNGVHYRTMGTLSRFETDGETFYACLSSTVNMAFRLQDVERIKGNVITLNTSPFEFD